MRLPFMLFALAIPSLALAQATATSDRAQTEIKQTSAKAGDAKDVKVNQVIVYGDDPCAPSTSDEVTICARLPESERYRIPENLRDDPDHPDAISWTRKAERLELAGRVGINSCSTAGAGGGTGCLTQLIQNWAKNERRDDDVNWVRLVEQARAERVGRIDQDSEDIEATERAAGR